MRLKSCPLPILALLPALAEAGAGYSLAPGYILNDAGLAGLLMAVDPAEDSLGADIITLALNVTFTADGTMARVLITDPSDPERWQVPEDVVPAGSSSSSFGSSSSGAVTLTFTESPFTLTLARASDGAVLFSSSPALVFKDQYLELTHAALDPAGRLFGIGESTRRSGMHMKKGTTATLWAHDKPAMWFHANLYGSHPVWYALSPDGTTSGGFLRSSSGMDVVYAEGGDSLTFKVIGGVLDLFVFAGPDAQAVAKQYTGVVGRPAMMPYWSLGFHQCRWGYTQLQDVVDVRANFSAAAIPLDTVWLDIDYMEHWRDFTYDPINFPPDQVVVRLCVPCLRRCRLVRSLLRSRGVWAGAACTAHLPVITCDQNPPL